MKTKHSMYSIVLAVGFCVIATLFGLAFFDVITTADLPGPGAVVTNPVVAKILVLGSATIVCGVFILLALFSLVDGRTKEKRL